MALRLSDALRNALNESQSLKHAMSNCVLKWYTGSQPATAEAAPTGTLLCTFSKSSGALTREVYSEGSVDLTGGAAGSVNTITVNSISILPAAVPFNTSLAQTATDVCTAINNNPMNQLFYAYVSATDKINIQAKPGLGATPNGWVVASTVTTITKTDSNMAGGVTAVNGLNWGDSVNGIIPKSTTETWSGVAAATGVPGWFRFEAALTDAGALDSADAIMRMDGAIGTSGAELNMATLSVTSGVTQTIDSFSVELPTA